MKIYRAGHPTETSCVVPLSSSEVCFLPRAALNFLSDSGIRSAPCGSEGSVNELYVGFCLVSQLSDHDKGQIILL